GGEQAIITKAGTVGAMIPRSPRLRFHACQLHRGRPAGAGLSRVEHLEREDGEHAALRRELRGVTKGAERAETGGRVLSPDARGHADASPATDAREHGDILLAIRRSVRHRVADDAR